MPDSPIIDTHLHLWDPSRLNYPWLRDVPALQRPFLLDDYRKACGRVQVEKMVFLQCEPIPEQNLQEVDWVISLARNDPRIQGIVSGAALEKGESVRPFLEELAARKRVRGVRRIIQFEKDIEFCLGKEFLRGVQMLPEYGFSFDICISHIQLDNTIRMVQQCPGVSFILDHIGKPDIKNQLFEPWRRGMKALAACPNVWCKISGVATEADHRNWTREHVRPYIQHAIECFGFDRVVYGGDWPVATLATDYPRWVETLEWVILGCSPEEKRNLFHDNAARFYRV
ncbi:MAG: amidohydrolase family protein [Planctomycetes bacterium]|nr:amidohydrolase family protein [Planctomycetota bacterium]